VSPTGSDHLCARCDRAMARAARRFPDGVVCPACYRASFRRVGTCRACDQRRVLPGRTAGGGLCAPCTGIDGFRCTTCGADDQVLHRIDECEHCHLRRRLTQLLAGDASPTATELIDLLCDLRKPRAIQALLRRNPSLIGLFHEIAAGRRTLTHAALDELQPAGTVDHLRDLCVDRGALPPRNRQLAAFDRWRTEILETITPVADRQIITSYATWHHRRRLAGHVEDDTLRPWATRVARQQIRVAIAFLGWLRARHTSLAVCRQAHLDRWFASGPTTRNHSVHFLHWATEQHHCPRLHIPTIQVPLPNPMSHPERIDLVARLLHDDRFVLADRVAGLLTVVCAQPVTRLTRLRLDAVLTEGGTTSVAIDTERIPLAEPVAALLLELRAAVAARFPGSPWLFPGRIPGQPVGASSLNQRLRAIGVTRAARVAALHELIGHVPTPVLADALGYNPNFVAERSARLSTGWNTYAGLKR